MFESAAGSTVFLDEIGELSPTNQAKLLRVLETKKVIRLGEVRERDIDIRLVAATNRDLNEEVAAGRFRQDLYYRLSGAMLWLPPLRDRPRELPVLAQMFLSEACERTGRSPMTISAEALLVLGAYHWPGNVRELKNLMGYVAAAYPDDVVEPWHVSERFAGAENTPAIGMPAPTPMEQSKRQLPLPAPAEFRPLAEEIAELERRRIQEALVAADGNQTQAAKLIHMPLRTFMNKLKRYELSGAEIRRK
jgi:transcriptional regulator with GAF, ATPase, and Fis domain